MAVDVLLEAMAALPAALAATTYLRTSAELQVAVVARHSANTADCYCNCHGHCHTWQSKGKTA